MKKGLLGSSPFCFILSQLSGEQRVDGGCGGGLFGAFFAAAAALAAGLAVECVRRFHIDRLDMLPEDIGHHSLRFDSFQRKIQLG